MFPSGHETAMMELACRQAELGRGRTSPNPLVGAVVVDETGPEPRVLSTGYHARAGADHAEVAALRPLGGRAAGMTLYVTLEPCNHTGRTGPCTEAVLAAGIARVAIGMRDPNPGVAGGGVERLRAAGVRVDVGVLEEACRRQNRGYLHWLATGRPYLTLKAAVSLDGRLAPPGRGPYWLTGAAARQRAHELRDASDGLLVGAGTVLADDPQLTVRLPPERVRGPGPRPPLRIVLDGELRTPPSARVVAPGTLIVAAAPADSVRLEALRARGAEVAELPAESGAGQVSLAALLDLLGSRGLHYVLCEGGATLHGALLDAGLYDDAAVFVAPLLLGETGVPLARGFRVPSFAAAPWLADAVVESLGQDALLRGEIHVHRTD